MPNVMVSVLNIGGALGSKPQFGWHPLLDCRAVMLPRCEIHWNLQGCLKLANRCQPLVGRSSPYCGDIWGTYCCLTSFFLIVNTCLSCEDIAQQSCAVVPKCCIFGGFLRPAFPASRVQQVSDLHLIFTLRPHHVWKYGRHPIYGRCRFASNSLLSHICYKNDTNSNWQWQ